MYYWEYVCGRFPPKNLPLAFGSSIHSALESYYKNGDEELSKNVFIKEFTKDKIKVKPKEDLEKEGKLGVKLLNEYFKYENKPYFEPDKIEFKFEVLLKHPVTKKPMEIPIKGVMDLITKDKMIVDHKTSSNVWREKDFDDDFQSVCYWLAYESIFGEEPSAFVYNFLIKRVGEPKFDFWALEVDLGKKIYFIEKTERIVKKIKRDLKNLNDRSFEQKIGKHCRWCPHRFYCLE